MISGLGPRVLVLDLRQFYLNPSEIRANQEYSRPFSISKADRSMALVDDFGPVLIEFVPIWWLFDDFYANLYLFASIWWISRILIQPCFHEFLDFFNFLIPFAQQMMTLSTRSQQEPGFSRVFGFWWSFFIICSLRSRIKIFMLASLALLF